MGRDACHTAGPNAVAIFVTRLNLYRNNPPVVDEELMVAFRLEQLFDKRMHTLSGGTRQKVSAALAFLFNPPILFLDEPTAGLDPVSVEVLKEKVQKSKKEGRLLIITSHIMSDLDDLATEVVYLEEGKILFNNSIEELKDITGEVKLGKAMAKMITGLGSRKNTEQALTSNQ